MNSMVQAAEGSSLQSSAQRNSVKNSAIIEHSVSKQSVLEQSILEQSILEQSGLGQTDTSQADTRQSIERFASVSEDPQVLTDIYYEQCNIAVWKRSLPDSFVQTVAQDIANNPMLNKVLQVRANNIQGDISPIAADRIYGEQLRAYIGEVVDMFCVLFDIEIAGLRLSLLDKAMCPRFHFDRVPCRLVSTFCGSGTEWLQSDGLDLSKLGHGSGGMPDEESGLILPGNNIHALKAGDVALLKGDTWEGNEGGALVHRSPALVAGECRLLMTLDFVA